MTTLVESSRAGLPEIQPYLLTDVLPIIYAVASAWRMTATPLWGS
jgi:hypothetical protein